MRRGRKKETIRSGTDSMVRKGSSETRTNGKRGGIDETWGKSGGNEEKK